MKMFPVLPLVMLFALACLVPGCTEPEEEAVRETLPAEEPAHLDAARPELPEETADIPDIGKPEPGREKAADFVLDDLAGESFTLSESLGENGTVIVFWASWCAPCIRAVPAINEFYESQASLPGEKRAALYSVNIQETPEQAEAAVERHGISYPVLLDRDGSVARLYGVRGVPTVLLLDREMGIIRQGHVFREIVSGFSP